LQTTHATHAHELGHEGKQVARRARTRGEEDFRVALATPELCELVLGVIARDLCVVLVHGGFVPHALAVDCGRLEGLHAKLLHVPSALHAALELGLVLFQVLLGQHLRPLVLVHERRRAARLYCGLGGGLLGHSGRWREVVFVVAARKRQEHQLVHQTNGPQ
jgi:hypothetical protein